MVRRGSLGIFLVTMELLEEIRGIPQAFHGIPQETSGIPKEIHGNLKEIHGVSKETHRIPEGTNGGPKEIHRNPIEIDGNPKETDGYLILEFLRNYLGFLKKNFGNTIKSNESHRKHKGILTKYADMLWIYKELQLKPTERLRKPRGFYESALKQTATDGGSPL